ncbi:MAG: ADP-ribosylglycohydrolase family protein [Gemmatimonadaceae bacterium]|nr:ADP-ribosylglycohydrolase family protein [Gemmatimonadaceae bacterium]
MSRSHSRRHFLARIGLGSAALAVPRVGRAGAQMDAIQPSGTGVLLEKLTEAIYGFVIADAMGGTIENNLPAKTRAEWGGWDFTTFIPNRNPRDIEAGTGKGNGRTTDDTINLENLIACYVRHADHLDAYDYATLVVKEMETRTLFIAERGKEMTALDRPLWWPERYMYQRIAINNHEPRYAGMGNWINEGFQGIVLPVGAVNAGDPWRAYREVTQFGMAHTESFGVEGAGVNAAAYAVAFSREASIERILEAARLVAKDGTRLAIDDVLAATDPADSLDRFIEKTRLAVLPYLQLAPAVFRSGPNPETDKKLREATNIGRPSRVAVVENVPIALAALKYGQGDYLRTMKAGLFYGRDAESIAAVAISLLAASKGRGVLPESLKREVDRVNRSDYAALSARFVEVIRAIYEKDRQRLDARRAVLG